MRNIVLLVAHPDDVAYMMGGTAWLLKETYRLHVLCATRGERGVQGLSADETAGIREKEERRASGELLGADVTFLGRVDREVFADRELAEAVTGTLTALDPVALFAPWAIDSHPDHSAVSELARKAMFLSGSECDLIYTEAGLGSQTTQFHPDVYVDITEVMEHKLQMLRCHACQNPEDRLAQNALRQAGFRGMQNRVRYAEGFKTPWPLGIRARASVLMDL